MRRPHERVAIASLDAYRYYTPKTTVDAPTRTVSRGPSRGREEGLSETCVECHFWYPHSLGLRVGECANPSSTHYGKPTFHDKSAEGCFVTRSFDGLEFMWCEDHRETIYMAELPRHRGCHIFVASANMPVEDEIEFTLAGD